MLKRCLFVLVLWASPVWGATAPATGPTPTPLDKYLNDLKTLHTSFLQTLADGQGKEIDRACRALRLQRLGVSEREDAFAAIIRCTADPAKADKRTRSKWSRVMRYAAVYNPDSEALVRFIKRKGGINACAARFSRCLGRGASARTAE